MLTTQSRVDAVFENIWLQFILRSFSLNLTIRGLSFYYALRRTEGEILTLWIIKLPGAFIVSTRSGNIFTVTWLIHDY